MLSSKHSHKSRQARSVGVGVGVHNRVTGRLCSSQIFKASAALCAVFLLFYWFGVTPQFPQTMDFDVCIIGNAETLKHALGMHAQWKNYPSFWAVWGAGHTMLPPNTPKPEHFFTFVCDDDCPWSVGLAKALEVTRVRQYSCEYYFTVRDLTCVH